MSYETFASTRGARVHVSRETPGDGVNREFHVDAATLEDVGEIFDGVLRLRDGHAVTRNDDDALRCEKELRDRSDVRLVDRAGDRCAFARRARRRAEPAEDDVPNRSIHRAAHDGAQDRAAARSDERARDDEQIISEHEAGGRRGPSRIAVEERHDDGHVAAADRHHPVHAEERRDARHREEPRKTVCARARANEEHAEHDARAERDRVERVTRRQEKRVCFRWCRAI